jgi:hypothetical protein
MRTLMRSSSSTVVPGGVACGAPVAYDKKKYTWQKDAKYLKKMCRKQ